MDSGRGEIGGPELDAGVMRRVKLELVARLGRYGLQRCADGNPCGMNMGEAHSQLFPTDNRPFRPWPTTCRYRAKFRERVESPDTG